MGIKQPGFYLLHLSFGTIMARNSHFFSIWNIVNFSLLLIISGLTISISVIVYSW